MYRFNDTGESFEKNSRILEIYAISAEALMQSHTSIMDSRTLISVFHLLLPRSLKVRSEEVTTTMLNVNADLEVFCRHAAVVHYADTSGWLLTHPSKFDCTFHPDKMKGLLNLSRFLERTV